MGTRKIKTIFLATILSFLPIAGLLATSICLPCVERGMHRYCQALRDAGLLREGVPLVGDSGVLFGMSDPKSPSCEKILAKWDVMVTLDKLELKEQLYQIGLFWGRGWIPDPPLTPQSFCKILIDRGLVVDDKKQACLDFYKTHPLP